MKLNNYLFSALVASLLLSCSTDDIIDGHEDASGIEYNYDAVLSLALKNNNGIATKAGESTELATNDPNFVGVLSVAIFDMDGNLVSFKEVKSENDKSVEAIEDIKTISQPVQVVAIANYSIDASGLKTVEDDSKNPTKLSDFRSQVELDNEVNGSLTMSSDLMKLNLRAGSNYVGFGTTVGEAPKDLNGVELTGKEISLYHNVSRVQLGRLEIRPNEKYGLNGEAIFELDHIFVANVKSKSYLFPDEEGSVEVGSATASDLWWVGAIDEGDEEGIGALKKNESTVKPFLGYNFVYDYAKDGIDELSDLDKLYPYLNTYWGLSANDPTAAVDTRANRIIGYPGENGRPAFTGAYDASHTLPIGIYFYVYENKKEKIGNQTLLVVRGDYKYKEKRTDKEYTVVENCYYTITLNENGQSSTDSNESAGHELIKRNYWYTVALKIEGPGSNKPYDNNISSNISASVKVKDWNVVSLNESVE